MAEHVQEPLEQLGWRVPRSIKIRIKKLAAERQTSVEEQARQAFERYLAEAEHETAKDRRERAQREVVAP